MPMERSRGRRGGAELKLHTTSSCTSDGSGNNAKHSQGKSRNFVFEIECQPCNYVLICFFCVFTWMLLFNFLL